MMSVYSEWKPHLIYVYKKTGKTSHEDTRNQSMEVRKRTTKVKRGYHRYTFV